MIRIFHFYYTIQNYVLEFCILRIKVKFRENFSHFLELRMQLKCAIIFTFLGLTYLLPFNTIINSYSHYTNCIQINILSPLTLLQILCLIYQIGGCLFNGLSVFGHIRLSGWEQRYGATMSVISVANMITILVLIRINLVEWLHIFLLLIFALINSICQAIIDTCT